MQRSGTGLGDRDGDLRVEGKAYYRFRDNSPFGRRNA
jgi:hypothetical protein